MMLKDKNKMYVLDQLNEWAMSAYYDNRSTFETDDLGNYKGKEYRKFEATLKILRRLIRKIK
jgi:hypothetical protein